MRSARENERTLMLNMNRLSSFKYGMREIMNEYGVSENVASSILASVIAKGSRISIDTAQAFVREQAKAGAYPEEASEEICNLLLAHSKER